MSARTWRVCVFLLLLATSFITAYALLALLGFFGGASGWGPFPLGGSLLLFATCGWILLWPRLGSWLGAVFLLCIACWPVITVISNLVFRNPVDFFLLALLVPISVGLWFTSREALGFTRHISPKPGLLYVSFGILMIVMLPVLAFANFYAGHRPAEVREFPVGFRGEAIIVWNEPGYPPLPISRGKLIEHFTHDGVIVTSTPRREGWAKDELYFYDSAGHRVEQRGTSARLVTIGETKAGEHSMQYSKIFVATDDEGAKQSIDEEEQRIQDLFEKLHPSNRGEF